MIQHALRRAILSLLTCALLIQISLAKSVSKQLRAKDGAIPLSVAAYGGGGASEGGYGEAGYGEAGYGEAGFGEGGSGEGGRFIAGGGGGGGGGAALGHKFTGLQSLVGAFGEVFNAILQTIGLIPKTNRGSGGY